LPPERYWQWLEEICAKVYALTAEGGAIYFMHRDKNGEQVLRLLALTAEGGAIYFMHRDKNGEQVLRLLREAG